MSAVELRNIDNVMGIAKALVPLVQTAPQAAARTLDVWMDEQRVHCVDRYIAASRILYGITLLDQGPKLTTLDISRIVNSMRWDSPLRGVDLGLGTRTKRPTIPPKNPPASPVAANSAVDGLNLHINLIPKVLGSESFHEEAGLLVFKAPAGKAEYYRA